MNTVLSAGSALLVGLLVCSNPPVDTPPTVEILPLREAEFFAATPSPAETQHRGLISTDEMFQGPLEQKFQPRVCAIGSTDCTALDDRPFQACRLSEDCAGLMRESMRRGEQFGLPLPGLVFKMTPAPR